MELIGNGRVARPLYALESVAVGQVAPLSYVIEDVVAGLGVIGYVPGEVVALVLVIGFHAQYACRSHGQEVSVIVFLAGQEVLLVVHLLEHVGRRGEAHVPGADESVVVQGVGGHGVGVVEQGVFGVVCVLVCAVDAVGPHVGAVARQRSILVVVQELDHLVGTGAQPLSATGLGTQVGVVVPFASGAHAHAVVCFVQYGARLLVGCVVTYTHPSAVGAVGGAALGAAVIDEMHVEVESAHVR